MTAVHIGIKTSPQSVDWRTIDQAWARIGEHDVFEPVWMNDHLTDPARERGGASCEALTLAAALAHRVGAAGVDAVAREVAQPLREAA